MSDDNENKEENLSKFIDIRKHLLYVLQKVMNSVNPIGKTSKMLEIYKQLYFNERQLSSFNREKLKDFLIENEYV